MVLLILESLGSTELLFILVMALVFMGPRKLPQISRTLGKHLAEFRRASEDFKRTWDREVTLEEFSEPQTASAGPNPSGENSILDHNNGQPLMLPTIEAVSADRVVPRQPDLFQSPGETDLTAAGEPGEVAHQAETSRKRDWL